MNNQWKRWAVGGLGAVLAVTVAAGTVTTTFANAQNTVMRTVMNPVAGTGTTVQHGGRGGPGGIGRGVSLTTIASVLTMTEADLQSALQAGKTVADLATEKGIALQTIVDTLIAEQKTQLQQAVTDGRLTQAQADARLAEVETQLPTQLSTAFTPGMRGGDRGMRGGFGLGADLATIATTLGITESELATSLQGGQSVADVAAAKGVELATVIDAILAEKSTALTQSVTDGRLTQAQVDQHLAMLETNLPHLLSLKGGMGHGMGGPGSHGRLGRDRGQQDAPSPLPTPSQQQNNAPVTPSDNSNV